MAESLDTALSDALAIKALLRQKAGLAPLA
jgi:hypothetical protein